MSVCNMLRSVYSDTFYVFFTYSPPAAARRKNDKAGSKKNRTLNKPDFLR